MKQYIFTTTLFSSIGLIAVFNLMLPITVTAATKTATVAATVTETASPSATTQNLRDRIEKIVDEKRDQIKGVLDEFDQKKRGTLGNVTRISEESLTIKTRKATEIIPIPTELIIEKAGKSIKASDIAVGDWVVVMGIIDNDTFVPKRILVSSTSLRPATPVVSLGTVKTVDKTQLEISPRSGQDTFKIATTTKTIYQDINGEEIKRTDLKQDMQALVIGAESSTNEKTARLIRILTVIETAKP